MQLIVLAPALLAVAVSVLRSPARAFLDVYLPALLLIPVQFRMRIAGLPDLGFQHSAVLAVAVCLLLFGRPRWRLTLTDILILGMMAISAYAEYRLKGFGAARNRFIEESCLILMPYVLAKLLVEQEGLRVAFPKRLVLIVACVSIVSVWQFRMSQNLFLDAVRSFFPGQFPAHKTGTGYRFGFGRISGPYTHSILYGIIAGVAIFLQVWLHRIRAWPNQRLSLALLGAVIVGSGMTMSRGPWIGILIGSAFAVFGYVRFRRTTLIRVLLLAVVVTPPGAIALHKYVSIDRRTAETRLQENAAYRMELIEVCVPIILERPLWGWGKDRWPAPRNLNSVDNHYLVLALNYGLISLGAFALIILLSCTRLAAVAWRLEPGNPTGVLAFTLLGALISIAVSIATVWMGAQTEPLFFMLIGWAESFVHGQQVRPPPARPAFRVLG